MKSKTSLALGFVIILGLALAGRLLFKQPASPEAARIDAARVAAPEPLSDPTAPPAIPTPAPESAQAEPVRNIPASTPASAPNTIAPTGPAPINAAAAETPAPPAKNPKPPLQDPLARDLMSLVGVNAEAEAYWLDAIFDSSLPNQEREDLIEDLNEEGLSDKKRPGPEDFPVIMNRIAIIEEIVPYADEFMLRHLSEAYKDLLNLADITLGGGKPVK